MDISPKRATAVRLLTTAGLFRQSDAESPLARLLWRYKIDLAPPYVRGFWGNLIVRGVAFALIWGLGMWLFVWSRQHMSPSSALGTTLIGGICYGLVTAGFYEYGRRKHNLPLWRDITPRL